MYYIRFFHFENYVFTNPGFLEPNQLMSLQEDAKSRIISSEVLKRHLHESVITASNRPMRLSVSSCQYNSNLLPCRHCVTQSVPVTPMHNSQEVSPSATPTPSGHRQKYYRFFSRGTTPKCTTPIEENGYLVEEESPSVGLASLFDQQPLNFALNRCHIRNTSDIECDVIAEVQITPPWILIFLVWQCFSVIWIRCIIVPVFETKTS